MTTIYCQLCKSRPLTNNIPLIPFCTSCIHQIDILYENHIKLFFQSLDLIVPKRKFRAEYNELIGDELNTEERTQLKDTILQHCQCYKKCE
jgi:hypothetical protein